MERYWWAIFGVAGATAYVAWKMRDRPAKEPLLLRLIYTLAPVLDKDSPERKQVTPKTAEHPSAKSVRVTPDTRQRPRRRKPGAVWDPADIYEA